MRSLPPETPAADIAAAIKNAQQMAAAAAPGAVAGAGGAGGVAGSAAPGPGNAPANAPVTGISNGVPPRDVAPPKAGAGAGQSGGGPSTTSNAPAAAGQPAAPDDTQPFVPLTAEDVPSMYTYDPWGRLNRFTYRFNARFDEAFFLPVANGYRRIPSPVRYGVHNFFSNLSEVPSVVNYGLQGRIVSGARSLGRFVVNSTIGIGGLFDVASKIKLRNPPTGFSETLSTWGLHPGAYLVLPLLGPSTVRDTVGFAGDYGISYGINVADLYRGWQSYGLSTVDAVDERANIGFRYYATGSPFEYETIRFLYVRKRLIEDQALHGKGRPKPRDANAPAGR
jgi:phospholipid-binding lipoprotein MlaA